MNSGAEVDDLSGSVYAGWLEKRSFMADCCLNVHFYQISSILYLMRYVHAGPSIYIISLNKFY